MRFTQTPTFGFTTKATGIVRELANEVHLSELYDPATGDQPPVKKPYKAIWDTGATGTVITRKVVRELNLLPIGKETVQTVGSGDKLDEYEADAFLVNIYLPNKVEVIGVRVCELSIGGSDVLIGMDIIAHGDFAITNYDGKTWWTFRVPSNEPIDFVEEIRERKRMSGPAVIKNRKERRTEKAKGRKGPRK